MTIGFETRVWSTEGGENVLRTQEGGFEEAGDQSRMAGEEVLLKCLCYPFKALGGWQLLGLECLQMVRDDCVTAFDV